MTTLVNLADRILNNLAIAVALLFIPIGLASWNLLGLSPFQASFYFGGHQAIHDSSILIFCPTFLILRRFWGLKAFWMIGMMWGFSELGFNGWTWVQSPSTIEGYLGPVWDTYIILVAVLFVLSFWRLRSSIRIWPILLYISFAAVSLLQLLAFTSVPVYGSYGTTGWELLWDSVIILTTAAMIRRRPNVKAK